ncbi:MAG: hypothetical protein R3346_02600 [Candidatus Spechtbacterales bacterium]|nr:hypothetical protein [Candidatus Spechtbacterales bacterium]
MNKINFSQNSKKSMVSLLLLISVIAIFFRFWQLESIPPGLWPDEAINANTAVSILEDNDLRVFYPDNNGREGLYFHLVAISFALFGISITTFKLVGAIAGALTVIGQYFLTKEVMILWGRFKKIKARNVRYISLLSSFFVATSFWHINFSRIGFRAILMPLVLVFSFYFMLRGLRTKRYLDTIIAGAIFGLGFHTYISFRLMVAVLGLMFLMWLVLAIKQGWTKRLLGLSLAYGLATIVTALPIGIYFLQNPNHFFVRASGVSVFGQENIGAMAALLESGIKHLGMFNVVGDRNWRHNLGGAPQLQPIVSLFFLVGALVVGKSSIKTFFNLLRDRAKRTLDNYYGFITGAFLFAWFVVMLLPGVLTYEGIPHALRVIGVIPIAYIFAGYGAYLALSKLFSLMEKRNMEKKFYPTVVAVLAVLVVATTFYSYFILWANHPQLESSFTVRFMDVGYTLNELPEGSPKYVLKTEGDLPTEVPKFLQSAEGMDNTIYIDTSKTADIEFESGSFVLTMHKDASFFDPILERYPESEIQEFERFYMLSIK